MKKTEALKIFLRLSAVFQFFWWGLSHLFYPKLYYDIIGIKDIDVTGGLALAATNEIGILALGIAWATWLLASEPVKNKAIIKVIYFVSIGSIAVFSYHMLFNGFPKGWLINTFLIVLQLAVITILYPWKESQLKSGA